MFWKQRMLLWLKLNWLHGWNLNFCRTKFSKFRCEWIWVLCMKANYMIIGTHRHRLPLWSQKVSCLHCSALQWYCVILGTHWQWLSLWSLKVLCLYKSALQWLFVIYSSPSFPWGSFVCMIWGFQYCEDLRHGHVGFTPCGVMGRQQCCRGTHCCYLPRN